MTPDTTDTPVRANAFGCITLPFLLIAAIPLGWGARAQWANGRLAREGDIVQGRVVELRYEPGNSSAGTRSARGRGTNGRSPVVTYTTRAGEARTVVGSVNRDPEPWTAGDTVDVIYDPANAARADLLSEVSGWKLWFGIWCAVALLPLVIAFAPVALLIRQRRNRARRARSFRRAALLVPQRDHGLDAECATHRHVTREQGDRD